MAPRIITGMVFFFFFSFLVLICGEGPVEPLEVVGAGMEAGNSEFIGVSSENGTLVSF